MYSASGNLQDPNRPELSYQNVFAKSTLGNLDSASTKCFHRFLGIQKEGGVKRKISCDSGTISNFTTWGALKETTLSSNMIKPGIRYFNSKEDRKIGHAFCGD
jgi:hypothetical protein